LRRRLRSRLAVSTVVANMLMISITLALAAILVAWAGTTYGTFSSGSGIYFAQRGQAMQERFVIENVFFNKTGTNHNIMIFVRNVGAEEVNIVGFYINSQSQSTKTASWLCTLPVTIGVGGVCEFSTDSTPVWSSGTVFNIVVTSARGNRATFTARGP
jgi:FlaG/FlaF family flagellin (archaellin)